MPKNLFSDAVIKEALGEHGPRRLPPRLSETLEDKVLRFVKRVQPQLDVERFQRTRIRDGRVEAQAARRLVSDRILLQRVTYQAGIHWSLPDTPEPTCLVLSGGAFKGSYEVGFLAYFERVWDAFAVNAVIGTSVGSVNAIALAQEGKAGIARLVKLWLRLSGDADMYSRHLAITTADNVLKAHLGKGVDELMADGGFEELKKSLLADFADEAALTGSGVGAAFTGAAAAGPWGLLLVGVGILLAGTGIAITLDQVDAKIAAVRSAVDQLMAAPGLFQFVALRNKLAQEIVPSGLGHPGKPKLRIAMVRLEDGALYYFTEDRKLLQGHPVLNKAKASWDLSNQQDKKVIADAVLASASPPALFPPVRIAEVNGADVVTKTGLFIDGGVREMLPLRAAYQMGYKRIVSILTTPTEIPEWKSSAFVPTIAEVAQRTIPIMIGEIADTDLSESDRRDGVELLSSYPHFELFDDAFSVDPGLIRINLAYGFMRAWLATIEVAGKSFNGWTIVLTWIAIEVLVEARREAWKLEIKATEAGLPNAIDAPLLTQIRQKKREVLEWVEFIYQIDPDALPLILENGAQQERIRDWWLRFEKHKAGTRAAFLNGLQVFQKLPVAALPGLHPATEATAPQTPQSSIAPLNN